MTILTTLFSFATTWLQGRQRATEASLEAEVIGIKAEASIAVAKATAITKLAETGQVQNYNLDLLAVEQMGKSWKDEVLLLVFLTPMLMAFIPGFDEVSLAGFAVIDQMPEWYRYTIVGMVVVIYGLRGLLEKVVSFNASK